MNYDEINFVDAIVALGESPHATLVFDIDSYKPEKYKDEEESRLIVYLPNNQQCNIREICLDNRDVSPWIIRHFHHQSHLELELELESTLTFTDNSLAIKVIYCICSETLDFVKQLLKMQSLPPTLVIDKLVKL